MKIGIVTTWFERGAAYVSRLYMETLQKQGHEVFIYARDGETYAIGDPKWDLPNVTWGKRSQCVIPTYIYRRDFEKWLQDNGIELVLFNEQRFWQPLLWCKALHVRTVAYIDYYTHDTVELFQAYDALICNTKRHFSVFDRHPQAAYVAWGTNTELFLPRQNNENEPADQSEVLFFTSAGMDPYRKGTDLLLKAFARMKHRAKLKIHTQVDLFQQIPECAEIIRSLEKSGQLELVQKTITAPGLFHTADVYVYPDRLDGLGLTVAEALSSGLACIVPDNGPTNEFILPGTGMTTKIERFFRRSDNYYWDLCEVNLDDLTAQLDFYAGNPKAVREAKQNARKAAEEHFCWEKNAVCLSGILEKIECRSCPEEILQKINSIDLNFRNFIRKYLGREIRFYFRMKKAWRNRRIAAGK